ncbi:cell division protein FtsQ/DivIB [Paratissierella segnis]|jgi:cell division protein FtsQ|uniref:FtsQ-type POTRA domain-containing protein n=1 Tax=Paratissierella segnis TaxID=2763679 RepID=A0A926IKP0_9FIRM|nr:FtsQ-type POTRA domain-containing protein [Paratissierella segnis]MBC8588495.1 FtsQ-type POTRA domain-containing protein [Paratissierella segnis]
MKKTTRVERKKRRKRIFFNVILLILITTILITFALNSDLFNISMINIEGNNKLSKDIIENASSIIKGENIFKVNLRNGEKSIKKLSYIKDVKIERKLPKTININITEREAVVQIKNISSYLLVDIEGYVLDFKEDKEEKLPIINGFNINVLPSENIFEIEHGQELKDLINDEKNIEIIRNFSEINLETDDNINIILNNGIVVAFGPLDDVKYKLRYLDEILKDIEKKQISVKMIIMNKGEKPIIVTNN